MNDGAKKILVGTLWSVLDPLVREEIENQGNERARFRKIPALDENDERSPYQDPRYAGIDKKDLPLTESLQDCINRLLPFYQNNILKAFETNDTVLVVAHGNSLRGIVKTLKNMTNEEIIKFNIPTGIPYLFELNDDLTLQNDRFLADPETLQKLMDEVANQGNKK
jgi:2,3-bisphosphoglycerate-dependent phosphoglycerate mutase